jgi:hypothetical protein
MLAAALPAAAFLLLLLPLPRPQQRLALPPRAGPDVEIAGAFHIHTNRSDGSGSIDDVAAAAARAGLQFIVLTDHGDGTRPPEPPQYRSGVLVLDGVELSTEGGHYIAVGLAPSPYPLRGDARDVVEDVRRLGGFGVVAHPDSPKPALRWTDWDVPFDAIEWINADSEWRDESLWDLARALVRYPFRPAETLSTLLNRPDRTLERWDVLARRRPVVALAGADAHARVGTTDEDDGYRGGLFLRLPSYEATFRTFSMRVRLPRPLGDDAATDAAAVIAAWRAGRLYTAIDAFASPPALDFSSNGGIVTARANSSGPGTIVIRRNGQIVAEQPLPEARFDTKGERGVYRAEVYLEGGGGSPPVPWLLSNSLHGLRDPLERPGAPTPPATAAASWSIQGGPWHVEKDDASTAMVSQTDPPKGEVALRYRLSNHARPYAALVISVGNALTAQTRLAFRAHATGPMRVSVQARHPQSASRWQRSVFLDTEPREIVVPFDDMRPIGGAGRFEPSRADTVLFVVDTINTLPGSSGSVTVGDLRVER